MYNVEEDLYTVPLIKEFRELLKKLEILDEVMTSTTFLPAWFFSGDNNLVFINIPGNIKHIGYGCFGSCQNLTEVTLNEGLETIESFAFGSTPIKKIIIPKSIKQIEHRAFFDSDIKEIFVPLRYISKFPERADIVQTWVGCNDEEFKKISVEIYG